MASLIHLNSLVAVFGIFLLNIADFKNSKNRLNRLDKLGHMVNLSKKKENAVIFARCPKFHPDLAILRENG